MTMGWLDCVWVGIALGRMALWRAWVWCIWKHRPSEARGLMTQSGRGHQCCREVAVIFGRLCRGMSRCGRLIAMWVSRYIGLFMIGCRLGVGCWGGCREGCGAGVRVLALGATDGFVSGAFGAAGWGALDGAENRLFFTVLRSFPGQPTCQQTKFRNQFRKVWSIVGGDMRPCRGWASGRVLVRFCSGVFLGTRGLHPWGRGVLHERQMYISLNWAGVAVAVGDVPGCMLVLCMRVSEFFLCVFVCVRARLFRDVTGD